MVHKTQNEIQNEFMICTYTCDAATTARALASAASAAPHGVCVDDITSRGSSTRSSSIANISSWPFRTIDLLGLEQWRIVCDGGRVNTIKERKRERERESTV